MPGRHLPPDHSLGDPNTLGGYAAVHARPAAFEGPDGMSYSVEIMLDETGDASRPVGAFLLFLRWARLGAQQVDGHLESTYLAYGTTADEARTAIGALPLADVRAILDTLVRDRQAAERGTTRKWWDVMKDDE